MMKRFLETLYTKVYINIVVESSQTIVYTEVCSKDEVIQAMHKTFETTTVNSKMYDYIKAYMKESPYYYISILDKSPLQGAMPTCTYSQMSQYCDIASSEYKCYNDSWSFYTSEYDLEALKHEYRTIGVDFIFSPFVVMADFFKDKINSALAVFVLVEENYISFSIFNNSKLLYAEYLNMQHNSDDEDILIDSSIDEDEEEDMDSINLEDITMDDDDSIIFDDFTNIEDLDDSDTIDEFSETQEIEESLEKDVDISTDRFNEDYHRFSLIQSSLNNFYKDEKYQSEFVEAIYIADGVGVSSDLKNYLEEELFLNVYTRKIDLAIAICDMAKVELNEV